MYTLFLNVILLITCSYLNAINDLLQGPVKLKKIQEEYLSDIKGLLNTLKSDDITKKERNSIVDTTIQALDNQLSQSPNQFNSLFLIIKSNLFEKNQLLFSTDEKSAFEVQMLRIKNKTQEELNQLQENLLNKSVNETNHFSNRITSFSHVNSSLNPFAR